MMKTAHTASADVRDAPPRFVLRPWQEVLIILLLGASAYLNSLHVPFVFDDRQNIVENVRIRDLGRMEWLTDTRLIGNLSFAMNDRLHGLSVAGYHLVNGAIHLLNALLVYILVRLTLRAPGFGERGDGGWTSPAFLAGLLFVVHPLQTQAVTYVVQRFASLATFWYLLSLVFYVSARLERRKGFWYGGALVAAVLAMKTKEIAFTLPVVIVLYEAMFLRGTMAERMRSVLPILSTMLIIPGTLFLKGVAPAAVFETDVPGAGTLAGELRPAEYLFTQFRVIVTYLRLFLLPVNQNLDYDYPVFRSLLDPAVLASALLLLGLLGTGVVLLLRGRADRSYRLAAFGIFWFFVTLMVESSIIPIRDVIYEHRVYLPSAGIFIALGSGLAALSGRCRREGRGRGVLVTGVMLLILVFLLAALVRRNMVWASPVSLWEDVISKSPRKARAYNNLAQGYLDAGRTAEAEGVFRKVLEMNPEDVMVHTNLGNYHFSRGDTGRALTEFEAALRIDPGFAPAQYNLGNVYARLRRYGDAIRSYREALRLNPDYAEAHNNLGNVYLSAGETERAEEAYREAIRLDPRSARARFNLGSVFLSKGNLPEARRELEMAVRLTPGFAEARNNLGVTYQRLGLFELARREFAETVRMNPRDASAHYNLGVLYAEEGRLDDASREFRTVLEIDPENTTARDSILRITGGRGKMDRNLLEVLPKKGP